MTTSLFQWLGIYTLKELYIYFYFYETVLFLRIAQLCIDFYLCSKFVIKYVVNSSCLKGYVEIKLFAGKFSASIGKTLGWVCNYDELQSKENLQ